jgi:hypothetical protein
MVAAIGRAPGLETGSYNRRPPRGCILRRAFCHPLRLTRVVTPPLHVGQELGERVPADHVRAALWPLAVTDSRYFAKVGRDLDAAAVV